MKKIFLFVVSIFAFTFFQHALADEASPRATATPTAIGYWQTIDDVTGLPRSIAQLCQLKNHMLYGRIIQVNYVKQEKPTDTCVLCDAKDPRYNRPILGSIFITDMQEYGNNPAIWTDGKVLDPKNGKVYDAKVSVSDNNQKLNMRGYIGIALLGRTQTWERVSDKALKKLLGNQKSLSPNGYYVMSTGKFVAPGYESCAAVQQAYDKMSNQAADAKADAS